MDSNLQTSIHQLNSDSNHILFVTNIAQIISNELVILSGGLHLVGGIHAHKVIKE